MSPFILEWSIDPELVNVLGFFSIRYYSILFGLGVYLSGAIAIYLFKSGPWPQLKVDLLGIYIIIGIVVGARLGHCIFYDPGYYFSNPVEMLLPIQHIDGSWQLTGYLGLASHGGILGILLALYYFSRKEDVSFMYLLDIIAICAPVAGAMIRLGNFFNSEIIGNPTGSNYGVIFTHVDQIARHPSQLYEAMAYALIFIFVFYNRKRLLRKRGRTFGLILILIFTARFLVEFSKIDQASFESGMAINMGQMLSIPFIIAGISMMIRAKAPKIS